MTVHVSGRSISALLLLSVNFQMERVELNVELPPNTFMLGPFTASTRSR